MSSECELKVVHGIAQLTLARPRARNGLTSELMAEFRAHLGSPEVAAAQALVITGQGETFCAGADLEMITAAAANGTLDETLLSLLDHLHASIRAVRALPIPVVAAVEGAAVGGGIGIAMMADLRVLARAAVFVPGYLRIGIPPDGGVSYALSRAIGGPQAVAALLRNRRISAAELANIGLADEVVDDTTTIVAAHALAKEVAGTAPRALLAVRQLVDLAPTHSLDEHLDDEAERIRACWLSGDFSEGAQAFLERRRPRFDRSMVEKSVTGVEPAIDCVAVPTQNSVDQGVP